VKPVMPAGRLMVKEEDGVTRWISLN
jgi:hypothetical protein